MGITIGPVGKLSVAEPETELETGITPEAEGEVLSEIAGREEPEGVEPDEAEIDDEGIDTVGLLAWELDTLEELALMVDAEADEETFMVKNRLLEGAAGTESSTERFFFP